MRQTVIALRLADLIGASDRDRAATYYLGLLMNTYCHADAAEQSRWFGDDISFKGDGFELLDKNTAQIISFIVRRVGSHGSGAARARRLAAFPVTGVKEMMSFLATHSTLGAQFADRIGLDEIACHAIRQAFEQWDGKCYPAHLRGEDICLPARLEAAISTRLWPISSVTVRPSCLMASIRPPRGMRSSMRSQRWGAASLGPTWTTSSKPWPIWWI
jgi:hypothetical protein